MIPVGGVERERHAGAGGVNRGRLGRLTASCGPRDGPAEPATTLGGRAGRRQWPAGASGGAVSPHLAESVQ